MLKKLSSKIIFMFVLIFSAFLFSAITNYIAIDTQKQHILLTDLLGDQKLFIERVTYSTINLADLAIMSKKDFENKKIKTNSSLEKNIADVEKMLLGFKNNEFIIDGKKVKLKFRKEFELNFMDVIEKTLIKWEETKDIIYFLTKYENMKNKKNYMEKVLEFEKINYELLEKSKEITIVCRDEAEYKKNLSNIIQILSIGISIFVFISLLFIIIQDFYRPILEIKKVFINMSHGEIKQKFIREKDDEFKELYEKFNEFIENLNIIFSLEDKIISENKIDGILEYINKNFKKFIPFNVISLVYKDSEGKTIKRTSKFEKEENKTMKTYHKITVERNKIIVPIEINTAYLGYVNFDFQNDVVIKNRYLNFLELIRDKISLGFYKNFLVKELLTIVTGSLAKMAESKDPETGRHLIRMSIYSQIITKKLYEQGNYHDEIDNEFIENIRITAPMHDIGKVSIADNILLKPGKLSEQEFEIMKTHAVSGGVILKSIDEKFKKYNINYFKMASDIAYGHQEKYDGTGYPKGLIGEEIPLSARITALADVFDALSSKRPYKEAFSLEKSYEIIKSSKGTHFDPKIVDAFFEANEEIIKIYEEYKEV